MYIVAIAWLYIIALLSLTRSTVTGGILTAIFFGLLPLALCVCLLNMSARNKKARLHDDQNIGITPTNDKTESVRDQ